MAQARCADFLMLVPGHWTLDIAASETQEFWLHPRAKVVTTLWHQEGQPGSWGGWHKLEKHCIQEKATKRRSKEKPNSLLQVG